jgi:hypothetical protein
MPYISKNIRYFAGRAGFANGRDGTAHGLSSRQTNEQGRKRREPQPVQPAAEVAVRMQPAQSGACLTRSATEDRGPDPTCRSLQER